MSIQIRMKGLEVGSALTVSDVSAGGSSASLAELSFESPALMTDKPRISGTQAEGDALTVDTTGLGATGPVTWFDYPSQVELATGPTFNTADLGGTAVIAAFDSETGLRATAPAMVYAPGTMPSHYVDDLAVLAALPQDDVTHQAVLSGNWSDPATWYGGRVPGAGARVLVPMGLTVVYDVFQPFLRLDWVRVDGTLERPLTKSTWMLLETLFISRGASWLCGDKDNPLPTEFTHTIVFSDRDYRTDPHNPTDIDLARDPRLWTRGLICQGLWREFGADQDHYVKATHQSSSFNGTYWDFVGIKADDTTIKLERAPEGWAVGNTVIIPSTKDYVVSWGDYGPLPSETEERVITDIDGDTLTLDAPLTYDHDNQISGSNRSDLFPHITLKEGRNISYESECKDDSTVWRKAHTVSMHHHSHADVWYCQFLDMGRTDKRYNNGGIVDDNGDFHNTYDNGPTQRVPLTARLPVISRYPIHFHHAGKDNGKDHATRPIFHGCYVARTVGLGMVQHGTDGDMVKCVIYEFAGAGMVGEDGSETGLWDDNIAIKTISEERLAPSPKLMQGKGGEYGDPFRWGYGFAMRGRLVRHVRNIAADVTYGHVFQHRGQGSTNTDAIGYLVRALRDPQDLTSFNLYTDASRTDAAGNLTSNPVNYPLHLTEGNEAYSCVGGWFITKYGNNQRHFANTRLKNFLVWGVNNTQAVNIEYIGQYVVDGFDVVGGKHYYGGNTAFVSVRRATVEGRGSFGISFSGNITSHPKNADTWTTSQPRWTVHGYHFKNVDTTTYPNGFFYEAPGSKPLNEVSIINADPKTNMLDDSLSPKLTQPKKVGILNVQTDTISEAVDNTTGYREDQISLVNEVLPNIILDASILTGAGDGRNLRGYMQRFGHNTYNDGGTEKNILVFRHLMTDQATGRPAKFSHWYEVQNLTSQTIGNQGEVFFSDTPVVREDITSAGAAGTPQVISITAGATGGNGTTYRLDTQDYIAPRHGFVLLDDVTGEVTYTPDPDWTGTDEMGFFIESDNQWETVWVDVLVGEDKPPATPVVDVNFIAFDHPTPGALGLQPLERPDTGDRAIDVTEYSSDAGANWSRAYYDWKRDVYEITMASDDVTPIAAGSYDLQLRVRTEFDGSVSAPSATVTVVVT